MLTFFRLLKNGVAMVLAVLCQGISDATIRFAKMNGGKLFDDIAFQTAMSFLAEGCVRLCV